MNVKYWISGFLRILILATSLIQPKKSSAQTSDTLLLPGAEHISKSRQGQIFAGDASSNLFLYDENGKKLYHFSPRKPARIHLLEAWNGLRPFAFYRDLQEFILLDRFLLADNNSQIDPEKIPYARLVAPALDGNLWVFDEASFVLKKIDIRNQSSLFSTPLDLILKAKSYELVFMREYQNLLYLADKQGFVLQFDQMGNFKKKLPLQKAEWLGFEEDELYTIEKDSLHFFQPYSFKTRKEPLPNGIFGAKEIIFLGKRIFWLDEKGLWMRRL
jgi:hypothetical protein